MVLGHLQQSMNLDALISRHALSKCPFNLHFIYILCRELSAGVEKLKLLSQVLSSLEKVTEVKPESSPELDPKDAQ